MNHPPVLDGQTPDIPHRHPQLRLGVDLVDVLPTRPAAARVAKLKLSQRNLKCGGNSEHINEA